MVAACREILARIAQAASFPTSINAKCSKFLKINTAWVFRSSTNGDIQTPRNDPSQPLVFPFRYIGGTHS